MQQRRLGSSGLEVSAIGLGCMTMTREAYVAVARDASVLVTWEPASRLHPVVNDGWQLPPGGA